MDVWNLRGGHLKILTQNEIEEIHQRALDVLQEIGCYFEHEEVLALFEKHGAMVDHSTGIVKLPETWWSRLCGLPFFAASCRPGPEERYPCGRGPGLFWSRNPSH